MDDMNMTRKEIYKARQSLPHLMNWDEMSTADRRAHDALDFREFINDRLTTDTLPTVYKFKEKEFLPSILKQYHLGYDAAMILLTEQMESFSLGKTVVLPTGKKIFVWADEKEISKGVWL